MIILGKENSTIFKELLKNDVEFLKKRQFINYSVLVGIRNRQIELVANKKCLK